MNLFLFCLPLAVPSTFRPSTFSQVKAGCFSTLSGNSHDLSNAVAVSGKARHTLSRYCCFACRCETERCTLTTCSLHISIRVQMLQRPSLQEAGRSCPRSSSRNRSKKWDLNTFVLQKFATTCSAPDTRCSLLDLCGVWSGQAQSQTTGRDA